MDIVDEDVAAKIGDFYEKYHQFVLFIALTEEGRKVLRDPRNDNVRDIHEDVHQQCQGVVQGVPL